MVHAHDGESLFRAARIDSSDDCTEAVRAAYLTALGLARTLDYQRIFRMWNFVENINGTNSEGLEVYRDFRRGRARAFHEFRPADRRRGRHRQPGPLPLLREVRTCGQRVGDLRRLPGRGSPAAADPVIAKYAGTLAAVDVFTFDNAFALVKSARIDAGRLGPFAIHP